MARIPEVTREQMKEEDRTVYDEIAESRGSIRGPYGILLHSPQLAQRVAATGAYVRFEGDLPKDLREVVILATAREIASQYEFTAHARLARELGVSESTIAALSDGSAPAGLSGDEELVVRLAQELLRNRNVSERTFDAVKDRFGVQGTVDLVGTIGHYQLVGNIIAAFGITLAPGMTPELKI